jgi:hypothetical protein
VGSRLANTLTNRTMFGPVGCRENGSFDESLMRSRAGQIMISPFEWQLFGDRGAKSGFADVFAHNKRADRANVNDTELGQLLGD